jgi:hypothetical protein
MAFTTFSGPIRAGTIREGAQRNAGLVLLAQTYDSGSLNGLAIANYDTAAFIIPAGSLITDIVVDFVVVATVATVTISVGSTSGGAELMAGIASGAGGRFRGVATAATQLAWSTSTTADTTIFVRNAVTAGAVTGGRFFLTVSYMQRLSSGVSNPSQTY